MDRELKLAKARERACQWRAENRERHREYTRQYRLAHKEECYEKNRQWAKDNPEVVREIMRRSRKRCPEKYHAAALRWRAKNPDARASFCAARRAKKKAVGGTFTRSEWAALKEKYGHVCLRCRESKPLSIDHVIPIDLDGRHSIENIQPLCIQCNSAKGTQVIDYRPEEWFFN